MTMPTIDARASKLQISVRPGNQLTLQLTWPDDLTGRTFTADIDGTALSVSVAGAVMTILFSAAITASFDGEKPHWHLVETTVGSQVKITGRVVITDSATESPASDVVVLEDTAEVTVTVLGEPGPATAFDWKQSVRVATTTAGTLASLFENGDTIDGVVLATGDRILIKDQATASQNGIYTVNASGAPTRATDADESIEVTGGLSVWVTEGTVNGDTGWTLTTNDPIVLGTTGLTFVQALGLGGVTTAIANEAATRAAADTAEAAARVSGDDASVATAAADATTKANAAQSAPAGWIRWPPLALMCRWPLTRSPGWPIRPQRRTPPRGPMSSLRSPRWWHRVLPRSTR
jgi:hypothetical protein